MRTAITMFAAICFAVAALTPQLDGEPWWEWAIGTAAMATGAIYLAVRAAIQDERKK